MFTELCLNQRNLTPANAFIQMEEYERPGKTKSFNVNWYQPYEEFPKTKRASA